MNHRERLLLRLDTVRSLSMPGDSVGAAMRQGVLLGLEMALTDVEEAAPTAQAPDRPVVRPEPSEAAAIPAAEAPTDVVAIPPARSPASPKGRKLNLSDEQRAERGRRLREGAARHRAERDALQVVEPEAPTVAPGAADIEATTPAASPAPTDRERVERALAKGMALPMIAAGMNLPLATVSPWAAAWQAAQISRTAKSRHARQQGVAS